MCDYLRECRHNSGDGVIIGCLKPATVKIWFERTEEEMLLFKELYLEDKRFFFKTLLLESTYACSDHAVLEKMKFVHELRNQMKQIIESGEVSEEGKKYAKRILERLS